MNLLQLVNRFMFESNISGSITSVTGLPRQTAQAVFKVQEGWLDIQNAREEWDFLWSEFSFNTQVGIKLYNEFPADYKNQSRRNYIDLTDPDGVVTSAAFVDYDQWVEPRSVVQNGRPTVYTIKPDDQIEFRSGTDKVYTITGEYYRQPVELVANTDTPNIDLSLHRIIIYQALITNSEFYTLLQDYSLYDKRYKDMRKRLVNRYTARTRLGGNLNEAVGNNTYSRRYNGPWRW